MHSTFSPQSNFTDKIENVACVSCAGNGRECELDQRYASLTHGRSGMRLMLGLASIMEGLELSNSFNSQSKIEKPFATFIGY